MEQRLLRFEQAPGQERLLLPGSAGWPADHGAQRRHPPGESRVRFCSPLWLQILDSVDAWLIQVVRDDQEGMSAILDWLSYVPKDRQKTRSLKLQATPKPQTLNPKPLMHATALRTNHLLVAVSLREPLCAKLLKPTLFKQIIFSSDAFC